MTTYVLGHDAKELQRLTLQAELLRPITERLLREAGLRSGMRVLELGCGAGDVCLLAAGIVGSDGRVVGVDRASDAVRLATERARTAGLRNVDFRQGTESDVVADAPFDLLIGRYLLVHQPDPVAFVRAAVRHLRPGGIAAFHEPHALSIPASRPPIPAYDAFCAAYHRVARVAGLNADAAARLAATLAEAGLALRGGFCERLVGLENSDLFFRWRAATYAALEAAADPDREPVDVARLATELQAAVAAVHGQVLGPDQWCIWAKLPTR